MPDAEVDVWDRVPKVLFTFEQLLTLYSYVPQWIGSIEGPTVPFGEGRRARITAQAIFATERAEAESAVRAHARAACENEGMIYKDEDWKVEYLIMHNAC